MSPTLQEKGSSTHLVVASSGNAALATATVAKELAVRCTVFLSEGAGEAVFNFLQEQGVETTVSGKYYVDALKAAKTMVANDLNAVLVPSYDHPLIWDGHASLITEIADQLPGEKKPDAIICSVGGGGLVGGVVTGCKLVGWDDVTVVAAETAGSNCFYQTMELNRTTINGTTRSAAPNVQQTWDEEHGVRLAAYIKRGSTVIPFYGQQRRLAGCVAQAYVESKFTGWFVPSPRGG